MREKFCFLDLRKFLFTWIVCFSFMISPLHLFLHRHHHIRQNTKGLEILRQKIQFRVDYITSVCSLNSELTEGICHPTGTIPADGIELGGTLWKRPIACQRPGSASTLWWSHWQLLINWSLNKQTQWSAKLTRNGLKIDSWSVAHLCKRRSCP